MYSVDDLNRDIDSFRQDQSCLSDTWCDISIAPSELEITHANNNRITYETNLHLEELRFFEFAFSALECELSKHRATSTSDCFGDVECVTRSHVDHLIYENSKLFISALPLSIAVRDIIHEEDLITSNRDSSLKQIKRDIERDRLVINGSLIVGADGGIESVNKVLTDKINTFLKKFNLPLLSSNAKDIVCMCILQKASRTHSGGITFQILQKLINSSNILLIPISNLAKPLQILFSFGSYSKSNKWGLKCQINASTVFKIRDVQNNDDNFDEDHDQETSPRIRGIYEHEIFLEIDPTKKSFEINENFSDIIGSSNNSGTVKIELLSKSK